MFVREDENFSNAAFVHLSDLAKADLFGAEQSASEEDWAKALERFQRLLDSEEPAVVEFGPRAFVAASTVAERRLRALPPVARERYESLFGDDARAAERLARARFSVDRLLGVARRYPLAQAATSALRAAAALAAEQGDPLALQRAVRELIARGEARPVEAALVLSRLAADGDAAAFAAFRQRVSSLLDQPLSQGGSGGSLREHVARLEAALGPVPEPPRIARAPLRATVIGEKPAAEEMLEARVRDLRPSDPRRDVQVLALPPAFAIDAGGATWASGRLGLYRFDRSTGGEPDRGSAEPVLRFGDLWGKAEEAVEIGDRALEPALAHGLLHWTTTRVLRASEQVHGELPRILALDPATGAIAWRLTAVPRAFGEDGAPVDTEEYVLEGPPAVFEDLVVYSASRLTDKTDCALVALEAATGKPRWFRFLASGADVANRYEERNQPTDPVRVAPSRAVVRDGVVYCTTNVGIVAAADARSGAVRWLFRYNRMGLTDPEKYAPEAFYDSGGWDESAPVVLDDAIVVTPEDSRFAYVLAKEPGPNGELILHDPSFKGDRSGLLAVDGSLGLLVFQAREVIGPNRDALYLVATGLDGARRWRTRAFELDEQLAGRCATAGSTLFLPTTRRIVRLDLAGGLQIDQLPAPRELTERGRSFFGNLTLEGERILSAATRHVVAIEPLD